jgi:hypothetical protein
MHTRAFLTTPAGCPCHFKSEHSQHRANLDAQAAAATIIIFQGRQAREGLMQSGKWYIAAVFVLLGGLVCGWMLPASGRSVPLSIQFSDNLSSGTLDRWQFPYPEDWVIQSEGPVHFLHMLRSREPLVPRRPMQFALLKGMNVGSFDFQARVRRAGKSVLIAFNYLDTLHFYYTHLSVDAGAKVAMHNGLFIVDGGPRRRIAGLEAAPVLPDTNWHHIRVRRDVRSGSIEVFVDEDHDPRFSLIDHTFNCGQVGVGSFDETGDFTDIRLTSNDAGCSPGPK